MVSYDEAWVTSKVSALSMQCGTAGLLLRVGSSDRSVGGLVADSLGIGEPSRGSQEGGQQERKTRSKAS